ncbi:hypothetical protein LJE86_12405 [bacterium BMS3Abin03]|nr:hypothetical protein [bacterium BMS3Abin03]
MPKNIRHLNIEQMEIWKQKTGTIKGEDQSFFLKKSCLNKNWEFEEKQKPAEVSRDSKS